MWTALREYVSRQLARRKKSFTKTIGCRCSIGLYQPGSTDNEWLGFVIQVGLPRLMLLRKREASLAGSEGG